MEKGFVSYVSEHCQHFFCKFLAFFCHPVGLLVAFSRVACRNNAFLGKKGEERVHLARANFSL